MCVCANIIYTRRGLTPGLRVELAHVTFAPASSAVSKLYVFRLITCVRTKSSNLRFPFAVETSRLRVLGVINVGPFLGAFTSSGISPVSFVMSVGLSVCPTVRVCQRASHWTGSHEIWHWDFMRSVDKIRIWLKSNKNIGHLKTEVRSVVACDIK